MMRIIMVTAGNYGARVVNTMAVHGLAPQIVAVFDYTGEGGDFLDDPSSLLPARTPDADLTVAAGLGGDLNLVAAEIAAESGSAGIIVESHAPGQLPDGLRSEIDSLVDCAIFPTPFCSLEPVGDPHIDAFASRFGKPEVEMEGNDRVVSVKVKRSAPCGSTFYVAENIRGVPLDEVDVAAGEKFHNYPCLASMEVDPRFGDTHLHVAGYLTREAFKRAAGVPGAHAEVDPEVCRGAECGFICMDVCPLVRLSMGTIRRGVTAEVDPFSCGACEKCMRECPSGAIKMMGPGKR
ncbi:MAG: 4Fe-4S binding protein [Methanothermobacter sp.]|jgi:NAD-dependent dihydropyrimidine dehydrogenase PreA subunit|nr:4Fe-4S binding protein [Methanothermobacter sp.]